MGRLFDFLFACPHYLNVKEVFSFFCLSGWPMLSKLKFILFCTGFKINLLWTVILVFGVVRNPVAR